jgi:hypothetical protein
MKSIFDQSTRDELKERIQALNENNKAQWGKMNITQMMRHCTKWDEMALGKTKYKQAFIGKLFGKIALKDILKEGPMKKNLPTVPSFKVNEPVNLYEEKTKWLRLLGEYEHYSGNGFMHPFFGMLTKEQMGWMAYKHVDHHLKQFNG